MQRLAPYATIALIPALLAALDALSAPAAADCTCRAQGRNFEQGQTVCLATPKGPRIATCGMVLNNSSWEFSGSAMLGVERRAAALSGAASILSYSSPVTGGSGAISAFTRVFDALRCRGWGDA